MTLEKQYHDELKMELQGVSYSSSTSKQVSVEEMEVREESLPNAEQIAQDTANMSKVVMSRKKRRLYEAIEVTILMFKCTCLFFHPVLYLE